MGMFCILGLLGGEHIVYSFETFEGLNQRINLTCISLDL